ncbi:MAG: DUF2269 family protein [Steroidobacter sp.]
MQINMRDMAIVVHANGTELSQRYWTFLNQWTALDVVAVAALVVVFYLMVAKPARNDIASKRQGTEQGVLGLNSSIHRVCEG